jgi:predicted metal-dependent phosphoesterase TrpH
MRIDLHTHSAVSDGTDTPTELVRAAAEAGLDVVAITDHDTTASWPEAVRAAHDTDLTLIRGSEISTQVGERSVHLLGYLFDPDEPALAAELDRIRDNRIPRLQEITRRLREDQGLAITWADVVAQAGSADSVGRPHLADALVALRFVASREEAFATLLDWRSPAYVPKYAPDTATAIGLVRAAGGVPVIAHPWAGSRRGVLDLALIAGLADAGLVGLEVDHLDHDENTREELRRVADDLGLLTTGSSDYHGTGKKGYDLGVCTTSPQAYEAILAAVGPNGIDPLE